MIHSTWRPTNFSLLLLLFFLLITGINEGFGQQPEKADTSSFRKLLPDYAKLQFAGGIGFISPGIGYTFLKDRLDISLFYSYIPERFTVDDLHSISLQLTAKLFRYKLNENIEILPLNVGFFTHHTFGSEYWVKLPDNYPEKYYWWKPGVNGGIFVGGEIKTKLLANKTPASGTAFYVRVGTRGLYITSKYGNSSIPLKDIVELGFGIAIYR